MLGALALGACVASTGLRAQPMPPPASRALPTLPGMGSVPAVPPTTSPGASDASQTVSLSATLAGDNRPVRSGIVWRIFEDRGMGAAPVLVTKSTSPATTSTLAPGSYIVHVAYGLASASRRIVVGSAPVTERLAIEAGALRLGGAIGEVPIPEDRMSFSIFQPLPNDSEGRLVAANVRAGEVVRLPVGTYHIVSTYGESNAIMRADLKVDRGKVTEATMNHRAATVTLKLVDGVGREAFAGTAFSVLTPGGDVIREAIGAFPTVTLAEGEYVLIARHNGKVYTRDFKVESGLNRDIEVLTTTG